jgi:[ribosomal protein S18]-alanine N-acetyltransferase
LSPGLACWPTRRKPPRARSICARPRQPHKRMPGLPCNERRTAQTWLRAAAFLGARASRMGMWTQLRQWLPGRRKLPPLRILALDSSAAHDLSRLHARGGFARGWSVGECEALLADRMVVADGAVTTRGLAEAIILSRIAHDEAEVLIIVVNPALRANGIGGRLFRQHCDTLTRKGVRRLFLEVDENNAAACALYQRQGFVTAGSRAGYYPLPDGTKATALILRRDLG